MFTVFQQPLLFCRQSLEVCSLLFQLIFILQGGGLEKICLAHAAFGVKKLTFALLLSERHSVCLGLGGFCRHS